MTVGFEVLKPYKTLILAQVESDAGEIIVESVIADFKSLLGFEEEPDLEIVTEGMTTSFEVSRPDSSGTDDMHVKFLHYTEKRAPGWYGGDGDVRDTLNHLIIACQLNRQVALYVSDSRKRRPATRQIKAGLGDGLGALQLLSSELLNAAFVTGPTRTLWLSGVHARVTVKPDSKILSGLNLRDALDPLDDQSYTFTAARSNVPLLRLPVGVSPRGSRIWVGATRHWNDFVATVARLLRHVAATTERKTKPLPVLATSATKIPDLKDAYEIHFLPPELLADDADLDPETREKMERWAYQAALQIQETDDSSLVAAVTMDDVPLGTLTLVFDTSDVENVRIESQVEPEPTCPDEYAEYQEELEEVSHDPAWIKVWYESGHTLTGGAIFEIRHRDQPFVAFRWADLTDYEVKKEKFWSGSFPENALDLIGNQGSLFCWVRNEWPLPGPPYSGTSGWLACDDGSMEIADFIHLDVGGAVPVLTLIHVKGAKSDSAGRGISVASYEVVTGQAVKNARFLDRLHLDVGLRAGLDKQIGKLVWFDGQPSTREEMLDAIAEIGASYLRRVVILQPHVRKSRLDEVREALRGGEEHSEEGRIRQLDTLLLSAQASCRSIGAELWVLADGA